MIDRKNDLKHSGADVGPLRRVVLDERIGVWVGCCGRDGVDAPLNACAGLSPRGRFTLVLWLSRALPAENAIRSIERAAAMADALVLVASDEDRLRWGALGENDLRALARGGGGKSVLLEPDPKRAVVGAMQWLRPDDVFCVVGPRDDDLVAVERLIALGATWRGAWDQPENGEFHDCPRGAFDEIPPPFPTTEDQARQGE